MIQLFELYDNVRSLRDKKIEGEVIGHGTLLWDQNTDPVLVYLVKVDERGSSSLHPAVAVLRADQTVGRWTDDTGSPASSEPDQSSRSDRTGAPAAAGEDHARRAISKESSPCSTD